MEGRGNTKERRGNELIISKREKEKKKEKNAGGREGRIKKQEEWERVKE